MIIDIVEYFIFVDDSNVLMMSYEQMKADLHSSIRMVATFLGHDIDDAMHVEQDSRAVHLHCHEEE